MTEVQQTSGLSRRDFLKLMGAAGTGLAFAPFVPWGNFMPNPSGATLEKVPVELPDGTQANVNTYPTNYAEVITYPKTGDRVLDEEAFRKWQFIRLPEEMGGSVNDVSAFRAFSMVCLHLWCLWKYYPSDDKKRGECPCHGSIYDPITGTAVAGPASLQAAPSDTLPKLDFETDADGFLWILPPVWGINANGVVGYGRLT
ncbi:MAG: Rieske 2Fe-2S domain-containing protein [Cenarchaeum sp. SB0665_bin_23]|nr:Rieske 2Fe-2S domain-containing protein [Cenarchaeum sp. SB0667_bin_13]MXY37376.1 Rieske 2Fe-2S domain-containing protein [Cenarchaeum sp. SB0664_bin_35]MXY60513.1 Rieske 2Fe-2S domain-containing protein [Cenarchaeum sp. SB0665_bin_23]MXZ93271.1 Rieske 2Fe-2S domain-containing protein [Cenarchaeum sp. SB0666_bin_15]MYB47479.1 Rieske 2Fe-2S domain-containing protein [Cenarchaeum sp. SB0662_bin_33]MYC79318.1 Rieske 2Fe-2S domain-containing protein [Cenarchaeum sp. SB0661_bin_35]MYD58043.1 Ri